MNRKRAAERQQPKRHHLCESAADIDKATLNYLQTIASHMVSKDKKRISLEVG